MRNLPVALLLAVAARGEVVAEAGPGVPEPALDRARAVVARVLEGVRGPVRPPVHLRLFRTRAAMEAAVRAVDRRAPADFAAYYDYGSRTIFAWMAPRADDALFSDGLPGLLLGALVHEAQHARGALEVADYRRRPAWRIEGEADRDAVLFLRGLDRPGAGAWEFWLQSRRLRLRARGLDAEPPDETIAPARLPPAQRATWYTLAFAAALGEEPPDLAWQVVDGFAEPRGDGYRLVAGPRSAAVLERRRGAGALVADVVTLPVGKGQVDLYHGEHKVALLKRGGARAMWRRPDGRWKRGRLHPSPPLEPGQRHRVELAANGDVRIDGRTIFKVEAAEGRRAFGVWDAAADVVPRS